MGSKPIPKDALKLLLVGNEHRGADSTGLAISQADGTINILKADTIAWRFVTQKMYTDFVDEHLHEDSWAVLLHTRAATQGSPRNNKNNHPMFNGAGAIVHNGIIHNDDMLFKSTGMERGAETDSDIIRAFVDKYGITEKCVSELNKLSGSAAGSAIHPSYPKKLLLFRSGSPMVLGSNDDFLVWSSEKATLHRAMRPWIERFGVWFQEQRPEIAFAPMADDTAWILGERGLEYHNRFKTLHGSYNEPYRRTYEGYKDRQTKWDREEQRTKNIARFTFEENEKAKKHHGKHKKFGNAYCLDCKKDWEIPEGAVPSHFTCNKDKGGCGKSLTYKPMIYVVN